MKTDYPHIKIKRGIGSKSVLAVLFLAPAVVMHERGGHIARHSGRKGQCEATIRLDVGSFGLNGRAGTRASVGGTADENRIDNIWVFQYNVETGQLMRNEPAYIDDFDSNNIKVDLKTNENGEHSVVCIVANIGKGEVNEETDSGESADTDGGAGTGDDSSGTTEETWVSNKYGELKDVFKTYQGFLSAAIPASAYRAVHLFQYGRGREQGKGHPDVRRVQAVGDSLQMLRQRPACTHVRQGKRLCRLGESRRA